jgi:hypothetical protein
MDHAKMGDRRRKGREEPRTWNLEPRKSVMAPSGGEDAERAELSRLKREKRAKNQGADSQDDGVDAMGAQLTAGRAAKTRTGGPFEFKAWD